jgi:hypothetical protein
MSVVVRKSLGRQLRALRLKAGKSAADIETAGVASTSKLHRIETGAGPFRLETVWALCQVYGADDVTRDRLAAMAKHTNDKGWWEDYTEVMPSWFGTYVELESAASKALTFHAETLPGLLQAPQYQRALFEVHPHADQAYVQGQLRIRSERQRAAFDRRSPLAVSAVIGQEALTRLVGGKPGMVEQERYLILISRRPNVEVRVVPADAGAHPATKGAFSILQFEGDSDHPDVVYLETYVGGRYVEDDRSLHEFHLLFDSVRAMSVPIEEFLT